MKYLLIIIALSLTGCQSLQYAGSSSYQIRQITDANGKTGFDISVKNGKEIATVKAHLVKDGERIEIDLEETGVAAFAGQQIASEAYKLAVKQAAEVAAATAIGMAMPAALPVVGDIISGGGLGAALIGGAGALAVKKAVESKPAAPAAP